jgi:hypothetical protein
MHVRFADRITLLLQSCRDGVDLIQYSLVREKILGGEHCVISRNPLVTPNDGLPTDCSFAGDQWRPIQLEMVLFRSFRNQLPIQ